MALLDTFFDLVAIDKVKLRIMFTQNAIVPDLTKEQRDATFFILYYQFLKHAFGLQYSDQIEGGVSLRIYPDELPASKEAISKFKSFLISLTNSAQFRSREIRIRDSDIAEVCSHQHLLIQCLDLVLGAMQFRLNDGHKVIPEGQKKRGSRTRHKEMLYKHIYKRVCAIYPRFNIGISTGIGGDWSNRWRHPYRHWRFTPAEYEFDARRAKPN